MFHIKSNSEIQPHSIAMKQHECNSEIQPHSLNLITTITCKWIVSRRCSCVEVGYIHIKVKREILTSRQKLSTHKIVHVEIPHTQRKLLNAQTQLSK